MYIIQISTTLAKSGGLHITGLSNLGSVYSFSGGEWHTLMKKPVEVKPKPTPKKASK